MIKKRFDAFCVSEASKKPHFIRFQNFMYGFKIKVNRFDKKSNNEQLRKFFFNFSKPLNFHRETLHLCHFVNEFLFFYHKLDNDIKFQKEPFYDV